MNTQIATPPFAGAGEAAAITAAIIWAVTICVYRHFGRGLPAAALNLYKILVALGCVAAVILVEQPTWPTNPNTWLWLLLSGVVGLVLSDTAFFVSLQNLRAGVASAMQIGRAHV